jgi:uncharacterized membrane protein YhhN
MFNNPRSFLLFFILIAIAELLTELFEAHQLRYFTKPLLLISLSVYFYFQTRFSGSFAKIIQAALFFSLLGDIALMFVSNNELFFTAGLGFFLIAHIFYILAFNRDIKFSGNGFKLLVALPFLIFSFLFFYALKDKLGELLIPVLVYTTVITIMGIFAAWRRGKTSGFSYYAILAGAILFILSDSSIAINKFLSPLPAAGIIIMSTYIAAQYLIVVGCLKYLEEKTMAIA